MHGNPINFTDPTGEFCLFACAAGGAIFGVSFYVGYHLIDNAIHGRAWDANMSWDGVFKSAAVGAVAGATFGLSLAAGGAAASYFGVSSGSGAIAVGAGIANVGVAGAVSGQAARATENAWYEDPLTEGLFRPEDMLLDAALAIGFTGLTGVARYRWNAYWGKPQPLNIFAQTLLPPNFHMAVGLRFGGRYYGFGYRAYPFHAGFYSGNASPSSPRAIYYDGKRFRVSLH